jgi:hypothetical protein
VEIKSKDVANSKVLDLGGFGHVEEMPAEGNWPEPAKFPWFGVEVRVNPTLTDTALVDLIEESGGLDDKDPSALLVIKQFIRQVIHADDFDDFWKLGKAHGYSTLQFAEVAARIIEAVTGDPTQESPASSATPLPTATNFPGASSKPTHTDLIERLEKEGRPDLAEFFLLAQEHAAGT